VPIRALGGVLLVGGVVVEALHELTVPPGSSAAGPLFDDWLHDTLILASAGVCAAGARRHPRDARAWACVAAALLCIGLGEVVWGLLYDNSDTAIPYPNPADAFDLASYPLFAAGLILIVRRRVPSIELHRWLDGLVSSWSWPPQWWRGRWTGMVMDVSLRFIHLIFSRLLGC
jgi:hypothetical protein